MRFTKYLILITLIHFSAFGQKKCEKEGDYYIKHFKYFEAAKAYQECFDKEPNNYSIAYKLAEAYLKYYNYEKAEKYYGLVVEFAVDKYPMSMYWHAESMKIRGDYQGAKKKFEELIKSSVFSHLS